MAKPHAAPPTPKPVDGAKEKEKSQGDGFERAAREEGRDDRFDPLDSTSRHAAQLGPPMTSSSSSSVALESASTQGTQDIAPRARVSMEELLPQLVRRIAWAGDRKRGTVQLELGAGRHEGTVITVHADNGRVRVELRGNDTADLERRIDARLRERGLEVDR